MSGSEKVMEAIEDTLKGVKEVKRDGFQGTYYKVRFEENRTTDISNVKALMQEHGIAVANFSFGGNWVTFRPLETEEVKRTVTETEYTFGQVTE